MASPKELAICHVIKNGTLLLIKGEEGINKGKWNAPSGELASSEKPEKAAMRHAFQQTGLYVNKVVRHGTIRLFLNGKVEYDYKMHVYSTKLFSGDLKPNIKGEARWFNANDLPFYEMWADDKYWVNLVLEGKKFDADFFLDEKNENVVKYQIRERKENVQEGASDRNCTGSYRDTCLWNCKQRGAESCDCACSLQALPGNYCNFHHSGNNGNDNHSCTAGNSSAADPAGNALE